MSKQSYDLNVTNNFAGETVLAIGQALVGHVNALNAQEIAARSNADADNLRQLQEFVAAATTRMNLIESKADTLTGGEFSQLEEVIMQVLQQPGFATLLQGLSINIGGTSYAMTSVVAALAAVKEIVRRDQANLVGGLPRLITLTLSDNSQHVFTAVEAITPAVRNEAGDIVTPELRTYTYTCPSFLGAPASQVYSYRADPIVIGGLTIGVPNITEVYRTQIVIDLTGQFSSGTTPTLVTPELSGDDYLGTTPPAPAPAPTPAPAPNLTALQAAVTTAEDDLAAAGQVRDDAQAGLTAAVAARDVAQAEVQVVYDALTSANADLTSASTALTSANADLTSTSEALVTAEAGGDAEQIAAATAARDAAQLAVDNAMEAVDAAQLVVNDALTAYNTEQADVAAGDVLVGEANAELNTAQQAYDAAVSALAAAQAALTAAAGG